MKKYLLSLPLVFLFYFTNAASIDVQTAQTVALNFFRVTNSSTNKTVVTAALKYTRIEADNSIDFYVFDMAPVKGFVIVSGNSNTIPVIGYSTESDFNLNVAQAIGINYWMNHVAARIHKSLQLDIQASSQITNMWNAYQNGLKPYGARSSSVSPLLTTTWDQEPNYNADCPYNTADHEQAVTGCVATAMAQIMKYWSYPARGKGSYTYIDSMPAFSNNYGRQSANFDTAFNWAQMPSAINSPNSFIAMLMYDCGVSVAMDYGDDNQGGSGAWVLQSEAGPGQPCAQYSYVNYFYYNPNTIQGIEKANYAQADFITLIENELNNNRVVQYEGDDVNGAGGHTWVCDGYDGNDNLHMNWGWSGRDNGYFAVTNLDAGQYLFNDGEGALIGIEPMSPVNVIAAASIQAVCPGGVTTLSAQGPASATYSWTPTVGLSCPTCAVTTVSPSSAAIYTVTADSAGVRGSATVAVSIVQQVTSGFTANGSSDCAVPAVIPFSNLSTNASNYLWDFGDGTTDTSTNPQHTYAAYGSYNVKLSAYNSCSADSVLRNQAVQLTDLAPVVAGQSICTGNTAILTATGTGLIQWYDAPAGGNLVSTGATYVTPVLTASTTYYVSSHIAPPANAAGPVDNTLGGGSYFTGTNEHGLFFNCTVPQTLNTVDVYAQSAGTRVIYVEDSNQNVLCSDTLNIPSGKSTVTLNFNLPVGVKLKLAISGNNGLYRNNSGAVYPYTSSDGTVVITNSDAGQPGYYYFFYNWKLQQPGCTTNATAVPVTVLNGGNSSITETSNGTTVTFTAAPGITSCTWNFGDGTTSTQLNAPHNYSTYGNYTVVLIESNGACTDTVTEVISLYPSGIDQLNNIELLSLYPDPAHDLLNINITTGTVGTGWKLDAYNILGQAVTERDVQLQSGTNTIALDISNLEPGVYILSLQNGKTVVNRRFVKTN